MSETGIILSVTEFITNTNLSVFIIVLMLICLMLFMTELMSNVALVAVLAPVVEVVCLVEAAAAEEDDCGASGTDGLQHRGQSGA